jgi:putative addiction module component (TIGR02574 family)
MMSKEEIQSMSYEERISLAAELLQSITIAHANDEWDPGVPPEHRAILAERMKEYNENPDEGTSWEEFLVELRERPKHA